MHRIPLFAKGQVSFLFNHFLKIHLRHLHRTWIYKLKKPFMKKLFISAFSFCLAVAVYAQKPVEVGGAPMYPTKNIIENAMNSKDHTTLVAAVKAAGLVETLQGTGPFTVFAPTNAAFAKLPAGTVDNLLKPENKATLSAVLTYHVIAGKFSSADVAKAIKA